MITGYNIDVHYEGVTYHVQTEDMGLDLKRIITHVFVGGAILLSKKTDYGRYLIHGFDEKKIKELMNDQHRTVVRIIQSGKLDVLKRKIEEEQQDRDEGRDPRAAFAPAITAKTADRPVREESDQPTGPSMATPAALPATGSARPAAAPGQDIEMVVERSEAPSRNTLGSFLNRIIQRTGSPRKLKIDVLAGTEIVSGQPSVMRVYTREAETGKPIPDCKVTIKVIGMTFRPVIHTGHTDKDGVFTLNIVIPDFTTGQAAVIAQAQSEFGFDELKLKVTRKG